MIRQSRLSRISITLQNSHSYVPGDEKGTLWASLANLSRIAATNENIDQIYGAFAETLRTFVHYDRLVFRLVEPEAGTVTTIFAHGDDLSGWAVGETNDASGTATALVIESGEPLLISDCGSDAVVENLYALQHSIEEFPGLIAVPLLSQGRLLGTVQLRSRTANRFTASDLEVVQAFATHLAPAIENAQHIQDLNTKTRESKSLLELGQVINSSLDVDSVFEKFGELMSELIPADRIVINTVNPGGLSHTIRHVRGGSVANRHVGYVQSLAGTFTESIIEHGRANVLNISDPNTADEIGRQFPSLRPSIGEGFRSFLTAPMVSEGRPIGSLYMLSCDQFAFGPRHEELISQIAAFAASAIQKSDLINQVSLESRERQVLAEIGQLFGSVNDFIDACERLEALISKLMPVDRFVINTLNPDGTTYTLRYANGSGLDEFDAGYVVELAGTTTEAVVEHGETIILDVADEDRADSVFATYPFTKVAYDAGLRTLMTAPLVTESQVIGSIHVYSSEPGAYTERAMDLFTQIAASAASALNRSDLMIHTRQQARERSVLAEIGRLIGSTLDFGDVFERVALQIKELLPADRIVVTTVDENIETVTDRYIYGQEIPNWDQNRVKEIEGLPTEAVIVDRQTVIIQPDQYAGSSKESGLAEGFEQGLLSAMFSPLVYGDKTIGSVSIKSTRPGAYRDEDRTVLRAIAVQIAGAVAASDLYLETMRLADERERRLEAESRNRELARVNQAKSEFLSTVSHELKTPLTSILAFASLLKKKTAKGITDKERKYLEVIQRNGEQLSRLISDLVDVSRMEGGAIDLARAPFDLLQSINDAIEAFAPVAAAKSQRIVFQTNEETLPLVADSLRVTQVISNLLSNASKYSPEGTEITIAIQRSDDSISVSVIDEGIGISPQDMALLFKPFFRADNLVTRSEPGTGLGLAIARSISELHGGNLDVESEPGKGTTFTMSIPVTPANPDAATEAA